MKLVGLPHKRMHIFFKGNNIERVDPSRNLIIDFCQKCILFGHILIAGLEEKTTFGKYRLFIIAHRHYVNFKGPMTTVWWFKNCNFQDLWALLSTKMQDFWAEIDQNRKCLECILIAFSPISESRMSHIHNSILLIAYVKKKMLICYALYYKILNYVKISFNLFPHIKGGDFNARGDIAPK